MRFSKFYVIYVCALGAMVQGCASEESPVAAEVSSQALSFTNCDGDKPDILYKAQVEFVWALQRAMADYEANPRSDAALHSFGDPDNGQYGRVHDTMRAMSDTWYLEGAGLPPGVSYDCTGKDYCGGRADGQDSAANSRNTGVVFVCSQEFWRGSVDEWGQVRGPFFYLAHEYWHWLGLDDESGDMSPAHVGWLASNRPLVAADNPESYAQFVRRFR